jgi:hypothetical protein
VATYEIRPDWDLATPGLRAAWEAGDRPRFYADPDLAPILMRVHASDDTASG